MGGLGTRLVYLYLAGVVLFLLTGLQCKAEDMMHMVVEPSEPVTEVFGGEGEEESTGESELEEDMVRGLSINGSLLVTKGYW